MCLSCVCWILHLPIPVAERRGGGSGIKLPLSCLSVNAESPTTELTALLTQPRLAGLCSKPGDVSESL